MELVNEIRVMGEVLRDANPIPDGNGMRVVFCLKVPCKADQRQLVYVDCIAGQETFEQFDGYLERGEIVMVSGSLSFRTYTMHTGEHKTLLVVMAETVEVFEEDEDVD